MFSAMPASASDGLRSSGVRFDFLFASFKWSKVALLKLFRIRAVMRGMVGSKGRKYRPCTPSTNGSPGDDHVIQMALKMR